MKRKSSKKLALHRETLHALTEDQVRIAGGGTTDSDNTIQTCFSCANTVFGTGSGCGWSRGSGWFSQQGCGGGGGSCVD
ncbi:MAG: class I lanthipeptide [Thermoanaerobaculia bacterium]